LVRYIYTYQISEFLREYRLILLLWAGYRRGLNIRLAPNILKISRVIVSVI
jgi:hypothetical protein